MSGFGSRRTRSSSALNASIGFDRRLAPYDVEQSRAHVAMLAEAAILTGEEAAELPEGLDEVGGELRDGRASRSTPDDEDVHMAIERRLTELVGPVGGKLHTARSRNDQVATDMALFVRDQADARPARCSSLMAALARPRRAPRWTGRCPATRTSSAPSPSTSRTTCSPTSGCSGATSSASPAASMRAADLPLGAGALAGVNWNTSRAAVAARARLRRRRARTRSTRSRTATSCSTT